MSKILVGVFVALIGGVIIGVVAGFMIGPINLESSPLTNMLGIPYEEKTTNPLQPDNPEDIRENQNVDIIEEIESEIEHETRAIMADHPLLGRWEITGYNEVEAHNMDELGTFIQFFDDGTGVEFHDIEPEIREFNWEAIGVRLTITPTDASFRIKSYEYEIDNDMVVLFLNRNRTSYIEATRIA